MGNMRCRGLEAGGMDARANSSLPDELSEGQGQAAYATTCDAEVYADEMKQAHLERRWA